MISGYSSSLRARAIGATTHFWEKRAIMAQFG
jgi:hypothetical protein